MTGFRDLFQADYDSVPAENIARDQENSWFRGLRRRAKSAMPPVLFLLLTWYFGWNALNGAHGLRSIHMRKQDLALAQADLKAADVQRAEWQQRVSGLQSSHLDPDTLDERARAMLNMADPTDIVVPYEKGKRLF